MTRSFVLLVVVAAAFASLAACEQSRTGVTSVRTLQTRLRYPAEEQQRFKEALAAAGVPYELVKGSDGEEWVQYLPDQEEKVAAVQHQLFGPELPTGRHIGFEGPMADDFKAWLSASGIPYTTLTKHGREYVVWDAADSPRVAKWPRFPAGYWRQLEKSGPISSSR